MDDIKEAQKGHESIEGIKRKIKAGKAQSEVYFHSEGIEHEAEKMAGVDKVL